jgi:hypothetical protein
MPVILRDVYVDATGILKDWINTQTALVGDGHPLPLGAHLRLLRSPGRGAYAMLSKVGGDTGWTEEGVASRARISASIFGFTEEEATAASIAYANTVTQIRAVKPIVRNCKIEMVDGITGPLVVPSTQGVQYLVDVDLYLIPQ